MMATPEFAGNTRWWVIYRGPLSSCNYACGYCPFAKTRNTRDELRHDADCLDRFVQWVRGRSEQIGVLFTPWGEALIHEHYRRNIAVLSHLPNVWRVAAQTNLSCDVKWLGKCDRSKVALWTTYHPEETQRPRFVQKSLNLTRMGIRHSVGVVGRREAFGEIEALRAELPRETYLWVNAWKREANYYSARERELLSSIDPLFAFNALPHHSRGDACRAGNLAFTVDGRGDMRRCHFIDGVIGNVYQPGFEAALRPRPCAIAECRCHIGYVHLERLRLDEVFGEGLLERVPSGWPDADFSRFFDSHPDSDR